MLAKYLVNAGAEVLSELKYFRAREKSHGAMWDAEMTLKYEDIIYYFKMWYHFGEERDMTEEEVFEHLGLKGFQTKDRFYDTSWHTRTYNNKLFLHVTGWFGFKSDDQALGKHPLVSGVGVDRNKMQITAEDEKEMLSLGFKVLVDFNKINIEGEPQCRK